MSEFQSNRCGVETLMISPWALNRIPTEPLRGWNRKLPRHFSNLNQFQSNRCGVETSVTNLFFCYNDSNRTVAGLKPALVHQSFRGQAIPIEPLRGWNSDAGYHFTAVTEIPIEPLRGWNEANGQFLPSLLHSNRTVAGLKQVEFDRNLTFPIPIEPLRGWNFFLMPDTIFLE